MKQACSSYSDKAKTSSIIIHGAHGEIIRMGIDLGKEIVHTGG